MTESSVKPRLGVGTMVTHARFGLGRVLGYDNDAYVVGFKGNAVQSFLFTDPTLQVTAPAGDPELDRVKQAVREVLGDYGWLETELELGARWAGGTMKLIPGKTETQAKEVPIEAFFKKIVGVRDKLRVLEQKINAHPALPPEDKLDLQGYITRCYGSLTTFNALFADKHAQFVGQQGKDGCD
ncbi:MAG TPA: hypothetical protein PKM88_03265 [bacterium]|nr:hypothetical protein [bacterium]